MLPAEFLKQKFLAGLDYEAYLATGSDEHRRRWKQVYDAATLSDAQRQLVAGFVREMNVLVISGIWCGDCVQQVPFIQRIAEANPTKIHVRYLDRDQHKDLSSQLHVNGGERIPLALLLAEDFAFCALFGDRSITRYRALARKHLGTSCPLAIVPPDPDELAATLADWLTEIERVQLMLRLSSRLRQKYGD